MFRTDGRDTHARHGRRPDFPQPAGAAQQWRPPSSTKSAGFTLRPPEQIDCTRGTRAYTARHAHTWHTAPGNVLPFIALLQQLLQPIQGFAHTAAVAKYTVFYAHKQTVGAGCYKFVRRIVNAATIESMIDHGRACGRSWQTMTGPVFDHEQP